MKLEAVARRNGGPLALVYEATEYEGRMYAGVLIVQDGLSRRWLTFRDTQTKERYILHLPKDAMRLRKPANTARVWLEIKHG